MKKWPIFLVGGGVAAVAAALFAVKKSSDTTNAIKDAVNAPPAALPLSPAAASKLPTVDLMLTGYWPFSARADEVKMEGGTKDRKGNPLHTVEDFLAGKSDHVSLSGDDAAWPYGQKIIIPWGDKTIIGRVTDTGSHFRGASKVYRFFAKEPIDVCVASSSTKIPSRQVAATIVPGDNFAKGAAVATSKFKDQTVVTGEGANRAAKIAAADVLVGAYFDALSRGL